MGLISLFKTPKNQQFSYKPRFWNPKEEEAEQRRLRVKQLETGGVDAMKTRISGGFRKGLGGEAAGGYRSARVRKSNSTLFIVMICLVVVAYIGYEYYFPDLDAWLTAPPPPVEEGY
ncbi:MAG: hypothetical protein ACJAZ9_001965 [Neolewinella sp.]|jgi:hypothetical protein